MIYIRTDMNNEIATGHMMRCLAIADAATLLGDETTFILADSEAVSLLNEKGYPSIVLHSSWDDMDEELDQLIPFIQSKGMKKLLIDSYQITENYLQELSRFVSLTYIDDLNLFYYPVNELICYANYWKKFHYEQKYKDVKLYLGEKYAPLREEFYCCEKKQIKENIENLLIISGGTDNNNIIRDILEEIRKKEFKNINVICGRYNQNYDILKKAYANQKNIFVRSEVKDIKKYFDDADLVLSAGGTTLYELCACGTPTISYAMADNQLDNVKQFEEDGLIRFAGDARKENVADNIIRLLPDYSYEMRVKRSEKMQELVDGKGAERIAKILETLA